MPGCKCGSGFFLCFSNWDSSYICNNLFSQGWCYLLFYSQCQFPTPDACRLCIWSYERFSFLIWFLPAPAVHLDKQILFFAGSAVHHSPRSPACVRNVPRRGTHSPWLKKGYTTSILEPLPITDSRHWSNSYSLNAIDPLPLSFTI